MATRVASAANPSAQTDHLTGFAGTLRDEAMPRAAVPGPPFPGPWPDRPPVSSFRPTRSAWLHAWRRCRGRALPARSRSAARWRIVLSNSPSWLATSTSAVITWPIWQRKRVRLATFSSCMAPPHSGQVWWKGRIDTFLLLHVTHAADERAPLLAGFTDKAKQKPRHLRHRQAIIHRDIVQGALRHGGRFGLARSLDHRDAARSRLIS